MIYCEQLHIRYFDSTFIILKDLFSVTQEKIQIQYTLNHSCKTRKYFRLNQDKEYIEPQKVHVLIKMKVKL